MASHAMLLADRENYQEASETDAEGRLHKGWRFVWPAQQRLWLESESAAAAAEQKFFTSALAVRMSMNDDKREINATVEMANTVLAETKEAQPDDADERQDPTDPWINRVAAAAFVARFESEQMLSARRADLEIILDQALKFEPSNRRYSHPNVMYNPEALALAGLLYLATRFGDVVSLRRLLRQLPQRPSSAATAFVGHPKAVNGLGLRTVEAAVRIGVEACITTRSQGYDEEPDSFAAREAIRQERQSERLALEEAWVFGNGEAPTWPCPPERWTRQRRRSLRIPGSIPKPATLPGDVKWPDFYFDAHTAATWTRCLRFVGAEASDSVRALIIANRDWLIDANAADDDADAGYVDRAWELALMERAAEQAKAWSCAERHQLVFDVLEACSDEAFMCAAAAFLLQSDLHHIEGAADDTDYLVLLREKIWSRLKNTRQWRWHRGSRSRGMEINLKRIVAVFYFTMDYGWGRGQSYTGGLHENQLTPFFPILTEIAIEAGACPTTALLFLDVLELVEARVAAPFVLDASTAWVSDGDTRFWNDYGMGRRVCKILSAEQIASQNAAQFLAVADSISAAGVPDGENLRTAIRDARG